MSVSEWPEWKQIMYRKIFPDFAKLRDSGGCPFCGMKIIMGEFRDTVSLKEYDITGICQKCQDDFFEEEEN